MRVVQGHLGLRRVELHTTVIVRSSKLRWGLCKSHEVQFALEQTASASASKDGKTTTTTTTYGWPSWDGVVDNCVVAKESEYSNAG